MASSKPNGAFTKGYAERKQWKLDEGLLRALEMTIPDRLPGVAAAPSVYDLGAGAGSYVRWFQERGYPLAVGFDGIPGVNKISEGRVIEVDLSKPYFGVSREFGTAHWAITIEVGEHIPYENESAFLDNVAASATMGLVVSWAVPGQRGRDHVNCQLPEYVACELGIRGWQLNHLMTESVRKVAGKGWDRKLMVFHPLD